MNLRKNELSPALDSESDPLPSSCEDVEDVRRGSICQVQPQWKASCYFSPRFDCESLLSRQSEIFLIVIRA